MPNGVASPVVRDASCSAHPGRHVGSIITESGERLCAAEWLRRERHLEEAA